LRGKNETWRQQNLLEIFVCWGVTVALAIVDWKRALIIVFLPHLFAVWGITTVNYLQHDGCDPDHPVNHSRNFVGKMFNWFTFNNGFHGIHHLHPGLHWSLLPAAHAREIAPTIHPALEQKSLATYLWKTFAVPGKRVRYDGAPLVLEPEGPDEDWVSPVAAHTLQK
jgi:fatty acid desaturase